MNKPGRLDLPLALSRAYVAGLLAVSLFAALFIFVCFNHVADAAQNAAIVEAVVPAFSGFFLMVIFFLPERDRQLAVFAISA